MSKRLHIILSDDSHIRMRRLATESGLTNAKLVELGLDLLEREHAPALRQLRVPAQESYMRASMLALLNPEVEFTPPSVELIDALTLPDEPEEPNTPEPVVSTETAPQGQPAPSADDDSWWRDL
jgi:hypothetical protein